MPVTAWYWSTPSPPKNPSSSSTNPQSRYTASDDPDRIPPPHLRPASSTSPLLPDSHSSTSAISSTSTILSQQASQLSSPTPTSNAILVDPPATRTPEEQAQRQRKQLTIFGAGLAFTAFSSVITRRALRRKVHAVGLAPVHNPRSTIRTPARARGAHSRKQNHGSQNARQAGKGGQGVAADASEEVSGPIEAVEALTLATLNVFSVTIMSIGAGMWYWDILSTEDLKMKVRRGMGIEEDGIEGERRAEEEFEEWLAGVLERKERKEGEGKGTGGGDGEGR